MAGLANVVAQQKALRRRRVEGELEREHATRQHGLPHTDDSSTDGDS